MLAVYTEAMMIVFSRLGLGRDAALCLQGALGQGCSDVCCAWTVIVHCIPCF